MSEEMEQAAFDWMNSLKPLPARLLIDAFAAGAAWQRERDAEIARALFTSPHGGNSSLEIVGNGIAEAILKAT